MKIIQINCVYGSGSTGKIVKDIHQYYLAQGLDSKVIYGRGQAVEEAGVYKVSNEFVCKARSFLARWNGNLYGMGKTDTKKMCAILEKEKPDIVHLHCNNGSFCDLFSLLEWLKEHKIPTVQTLHAEFMYTGGCGYAFDCEQWKTGCKACPDVKAAIGSGNAAAPARNWQKMKDAFEGFETLFVTGVSDWITERAAQAPILADKPMTTVLNGLDTAIFHGDYSEPEIIGKLKSEGKKTVLYVSPYFEDENKGGKWLLALAERLRSEAIHFVVAGPTQESYNISNITFLGKISDPKQLAAYYASADLLVLTSKRETFSMVCAESLCCGTPIVGFEAGAPERIALKEYSTFVPYGDVDALEATVKEWLNKDINKKALLEKAQQEYSKQAMAEGYLAVYAKLLEKQDATKD